LSPVVVLHLKSQRFSREAKEIIYDRQGSAIDSVRFPALSFSNTPSRSLWEPAICGVRNVINKEVFGVQLTA